MDTNVALAVESFLEAQKIQGSIYPWGPLIASLFGIVLLGASLLYFTVLRKKEHEGLVATFIIAVVIGGIFAVVGGGVFIDEHLDYKRWEASPERYAMQELLTRLAQR